MSVQFSYSKYCKRFQPPLKTHHGLWTHRQGLYVQLVDSNDPQQQGVGEIAPLPWFESESLEAAIAICQSLPAEITLDMIQAIPDHYPACQFGFESAWESLAGGVSINEEELIFCALLPTGEAGFQAWSGLYQQGYRTFKWKIGVESASLERERCQRLLDCLPADCQLRLDANGGLTVVEAQNWLNFCDRNLDSATQPGIEFLEQPLPVENFSTLQRLSRDYATPLALDESVARLAQLRQCHGEGWTGVYVIKPAITGSPQALRRFCQQYDLDIVLSTVFETEVGRRASLSLAADLIRTQRALGYGIQHWFPETERQI